MDLYNRLITVVFNMTKSCALSKLSCTYKSPEEGKGVLIEYIFCFSGSQLDLESAFLTGSQVIAIPLIHDYRKSLKKEEVTSRF